MNLSPNRTVFFCVCVLGAISHPITSTAAPPAGYSLIWQDEFNAEEIDPRNWTRFRDDSAFQAGVDRADATFVENGYLTVAAYTNAANKHVSGSLITRDRESFHYGYFETRIRYRGGQGLNQAFWVQSPTMRELDGNIPGNPDIYGTEIDVTEHRTYDGTGTWIADRTHQAIHWDGYAADHKSSGGLSPPNFGNLNDSWHLYALEWTPAGYKYFIDGVETRNITQAVSARDHHVILSNAIFPAGGWTNGPPPGGYGTLAENNFGMDVDYVRVYTNPATEVTRKDQVISVNFTNSGVSSHQVQGAYGVTSESSLVNGWQNLNTTVGVVGGVYSKENLTYRDGRRSPVDLSVNKPFSGSTFEPILDGTPFKAGLTDFVSASDSVQVTLNELDHAYEFGYKVIVYLTGFAPNTGASISDGTTTYYYQSPDPASPTLIQTTDTNPLDGIPTANFAVFGSDFNPLLADTLTLTLDTLDFQSGHAPALGGLQILGAKQLFGDFSRDGIIAANDLDLLTAAVGTSGGEFNLNNFTDEAVNNEDRRLWLQYVAETTFGDANLDKTVDIADLQILSNNLSAVGNGWGGADFNGDGITDQQDIDIAEMYWDNNGPLTFYEAAVATGLQFAGDFDKDGDVDGRDFLIWQRGWSPNLLGMSDLVDWQENYNTSAIAAIAALTSVPEPKSLLIIPAILVSFFCNRYQLK